MLFLQIKKIVLKINYDLNSRTNILLPSYIDIIDIKVIYQRIDAVIKEHVMTKN